MKNHPSQLSHMNIDFVEVISGGHHFNSTDTRTLNSSYVSYSSSPSLYTRVSDPCGSTVFLCFQTREATDSQEDSQDEYDLSDPVDVQSDLAEPFCFGSSFQTSYIAIIQSTSSGYYHGDQTTRHVYKYNIFF